MYSAGCAGLYQGSKWRMSTENSLNRTNESNSNVGFRQCLHFVIQFCLFPIGLLNNALLVLQGPPTSWITHAELWMYCYGFWNFSPVICFIYFNNDALSQPSRCHSGLSFFCLFLNSPIVLGSEIGKRRELHWRIEEGLDAHLIIFSLLIVICYQVKYG